MKNYIVDIDGVLCEDIDNEFPEKMASAQEMPGAKKWLEQIRREGHSITLFTSRLHSQHNAVTEKWLKEHGFPYDRIIYGKPRGGQYVYVDNLRIQGITFKGAFTPLVKVKKEIEVFRDGSEE
jgi:hypothetical protein